MKFVLRRAVFLLALVCFVPAHAGKTVHLADFMSDDSCRDATAAVRRALEYCAGTKASKLVLTGGVLNFEPDMAVEKYLFASNNDESLKRITFYLENLRDFTIEGCGTRLIFSGFVSPFVLIGCRNVTVRDVSIDYTRTFNSEGVVADVGDGWLDVDFPHYYICDIVNGRLIFKDRAGRIYPYSNLLEFDSDRREPAFHAKDYWVGSENMPAEKCGNDRYRIFHKGISAKRGNVMVFGAAARYNPGFTISDCCGVTLQNVDLHHCGGMGVIAQFSSDIEIDSMRVVPSGERMISITADATHFVNCGGYIKMKNCVFENQKDDATNIHGLYMAVEEVVSDRTLMLGWRHPAQFGLDFIKSGMMLEIVDNKNMVAYARCKVKSIRRINKEFVEVTFERPLPEGVRAGHVVAADDIYPDVTISGCRMRGNRARGLLLGSRGHVVVEDSYFHIAGAAILFEGDARYWYEQSGVRDVTICDCIFENCNYGSRSWGAACIAVGSGIVQRSGTRYHRGIRLERNIFRAFDSRIVNIYCVDGFLFAASNRVERTYDYPCRNFTENDMFVTDECDNVQIEFFGVSE